VHKLGDALLQKLGEHVEFSDNRVLDEHLAHPDNKVLEEFVELVELSR
jgi:hypothetical protein